MSQYHIILVEDDPDLRESLTEIFELHSIKVSAFPNAEKALPLIQYSSKAIIVSDIRMPNMTGIELMEHVHATDPSFPVILISGHADIELALRCVKLGAFDFVEKPLRPERLVSLAQKAIQHRQLTLENRKLKRDSPRHVSLDEVLLGQSDAMRKLKERLITLADADINIVINGETGTGKEMIARTLHSQSARSNHPFVAINCGAMPENLIESELFGHEQGSFTGAAKKRIGKIEYASGGTLFLDEIESMPASAQIRLLRVLQEGELERVGSNQTIKVDLKVLAASKADLLTLSQAGEFRQDLYYRLNVASLQIPPLRDRKTDIPLLLSHFINRSQERLNKTCQPLSPHQFQQLIAHDWPGNVRELVNEADRLVLGISDIVTPYDQPECTSLSHQMAQFEKQVLHHALICFQGHIGETAAHLDIPRKNLYLRMKKYGLSRENYSDEPSLEE